MPFITFELSLVVSIWCNFKPYYFLVPFPETFEFKLMADVNAKTTFDPINQLSEV